MGAETLRIVQMQQHCMVQDNYPAGDLETAFAEIQALDKAQKERAEADLAQAYADGYEIADVTVGGNERVLLTVWTLRPRVVTMKITELVGDSGIAQRYVMREDEAKAHALRELDQANAFALKLDQRIFPTDPNNHWRIEGHDADEE